MRALKDFRSHYAKMAAEHRWNADRATSKGLHDLAARDLRAAERSQEKANAFSVAMRQMAMS